MVESLKLIGQLHYKSFTAHFGLWRSTRSKYIETPPTLLVMSSSLPRLECRYDDRFQKIILTFLVGRVMASQWNWFYTRFLNPHSTGGTLCVTEQVLPTLKTNFRALLKVFLELYSNIVNRFLIVLSRVYPSIVDFVVVGLLIPREECYLRLVLFPIKFCVWTHHHRQHDKT